MGHRAGEELTTGTRNVFIGAFSGDDSSTASDNTCVGWESGTALSTGGNNTLIGVEAGQDITGGGNNTCLGHDAGRSNSPSGNITTGNYNIVLGNNDTANLYCADTSISSSDSRDKTDITDFTKGLDWIKALRPVTYRWDKRSWYGSGVEGESDEFLGTPDGSKKRTKLHVGFLAQEALEIEKANGYGFSKDDMLVVNLNEDETAYGMKYERLVPVLVNAIKELSAEVEQLKSQLNN